MPYATIVELPPGLRKALPKHAQEIYAAAFNAALKEYKVEVRAHAVAWAAVKAKYCKDPDGTWRVKEVIPQSTIRTDIPIPAGFWYNEPSALERVVEAEWSTAYINDLPDSAFLYIEPGGSKDGDGKTIPRTLRWFPFKNASGAVDYWHLSNTPSSIPQAKGLSAVEKAACMKRAQRLLANAKESMTMATENRVAEAVWDAAYMNDLPDSAFLYIEPGGTKDDSGKTTPRSLRYFPVKDASGAVDLPHLRNALARIPQSSLSATIKAACAKRAQDLLQKAKENVPLSQEERIQEIFSVGTVEPLGENDFRIEFLTHGLTEKGLPLRRYYPERTCEAAAEAGIFDGVKMYMNHRDPTADAKRGHRDLREWAATIKPGTVRCVDGNIRAVCHAHSPEALSILMDPVAKGAVGLSHDSIVRRSLGRINGEDVHVIEAIVACTSVDLVPEGNARGRVLEALPGTAPTQLEEVPEMALEDVTLEQLREARPELVVQIEAAAREDANVADQMKSKDAEIATLKDQVAKATEALAAQGREKQVVDLVNAAETLTAPTKERIIEALKSKNIPTEGVEAAVKEAVEAEAKYTAELLKAAGVKTQVAGAGPTAVSTGKVSEAYEAAYETKCKEHGIPYHKVAD